MTNAEKNCTTPLAVLQLSAKLENHVKFHCFAPKIYIRAYKNYDDLPLKYHKIKGLSFLCN